MPAWIAFSVAAALFQCWRTAMQQRLRDQLSVNAAGVVRYLYGVPLGVALAAGYGLAMGYSLPVIGLAVLVLCAAAGFLQILGTNLLIMAFGYRNFAVGTAYSKTEAMQTAVVATILLGEHLSPLAWLGIGVGVGGVLYLSLAGRGTTPVELLRGVTQPAALCGIGAGFCFGFTGVLIKAANQVMPGDDLIFKALLILAMTNAMQTVMQGGYLAWREPAQFVAVFRSWRISAQVGTLSALGSACWFSAFALAPVAMVRAVGQVEILFTLAFSRFYLREKAKRADVLGALVVVSGVVLVLLGG
ncbi:EamA family transporter [Falsiroseomonas stagni]|uniref:EamA-like transporter family protein n=1 Tax=Falsiroseomonas stagni DSM 19981 TaxID=1123062 RepID=A0A1I3XL02_9PROT|nr:EamA family transporter [Falsiroseomonas stagni]SFK20039.1 EamA-like transporter family protein [Falsiroseomonas stagni DSM 19981]